MKKYFLLTLMVGALVSFAGYQNRAWGLTAQDISSNSTLTTVIAKVMNVDPVTRKVTLETTEGKRLTLKVGKQAKNFNQVKVGDMVQAQYYQSIAWEILPPGKAAQPAPTVVSATATTTAPKGEKPDVDVVETTHVEGTIEKIDQPNAMVVIKGSDGTSVPIKVRYPDKLSDVKVGQKIAATFTEAFAISVEPAPKIK